MNQHNKKVLAEMLKKQIVETDMMFKNGERPNYIIGYLKGTINVAIETLESDQYL